MVNRKLNKNNKVIKRTKLTIERLGQVIKGITIVQEWKKEDSALRALISLRLALLEHPLVLELIGVDGQTLLYLYQLQTNLILEYDFITKKRDTRTLPSYPLRNSIILNSRTTIYTIND